MRIARTSFVRSFIVWIAAPALLSACAAAQSAWSLQQSPGNVPFELMAAESSSSSLLVNAPMPSNAASHDEAVAVAPVAPAQTSRILGVMPNFSSVSADEKLPALHADEKFILAGRNSFDYSSFLLVSIQSGFAMKSHSTPEFHQGVAGYGRYYWHTLADTADENFMVAGTFPAIFHEDPRFYTLGHGSPLRRVVYAATRVLQTRTDSGGETVNLSEIAGAGAAAGISSLYYPGVDRTWTKIGQKWLTSCVIDSANYVFKEFWPDINRKFLHTH